MPIAEFSHDAQGEQKLKAFLGEMRPRACHLLVDIQGEDFQWRELPKLGRSDRRRMMERKCAQLFPKAIRRHIKARESEVLFSALHATDSLQARMELLSAHALAGISSPALLSARLPALQKDLRAHRLLLLVGLHGGGIRHSLFIAGELRLSRMVCMEIDARKLLDLCKELEKMILYLAHLRLEGSDDLRVKLIGDAQTSQGIIDAYPQHCQTPAQFLELLQSHSVEVLYAEWIMRHPVNHYAIPQDVRPLRIRRMRLNLQGVACALLGSSAIFLGYSLMTARLHGEQHTFFQDRANVYRQLHDEVRRSLPVASFSAEALAEIVAALRMWGRKMPELLSLSDALDAHPRIKLQRVQWQSKEGSGMQIQIIAHLQKFDGDYHQAQEQISAFVEALGRSSHISDLRQTELPFVPSGNAVLSGNLHAAEQTRFALAFALGDDAHGGP